MIRMIFSIEIKDKRWLQTKANIMDVSMAELVRRAIKNYQLQLLKASDSVESSPES